MRQLRRYHERNPVQTSDRDVKLCASEPGQGVSHGMEFE